MLHFSRGKIGTIIGACLLGLIFALPNAIPSSVMGKMPGFIPKNTINLGLDLQGGAHLLLEVQVDVVYKERLENLKVDVRRALRNREENIRIQHGTRISDGVLRVLITDPRDMDVAFTQLKSLSQAVAGGPLGIGAAKKEFDIDRVTDNEISFTLTETAKQSIEVSAVSQSIEIVRRRIDELGTREPIIQRQGARRIIVQVPGETNPQRLKELLKQTAKLNFQMVYSDDPGNVQEAVEGRVFRDAVLMSSENPQEPYILIASEILVSGENLVNAQPGFDQQTNEAVVNFRFNNRGALKFGRVTSEAVGKRFAIVLDGIVVSAPTIREAITGGSGQISGSFTVESANNLAILLRSGALPAPMAIMEERTVGPGMGADSVAAGKIAAIIGFGAVIIFIILAYGRFGLYANIALITNLILIAGALSMLQATLTLPGIAGIVLTIGMAVDANVLIFERMREEIRSGKTPINAVEAGYTRAKVAIIDANVTTFIAAGILFMIGSGPVKGFAVTLAIGIITSVFTAFTLTRLMVATWIRKARPSELPI
jgi:preprotein translocase subunit SecD